MGLRRRTAGPVVLCAKRASSCSTSRSRAMIGVHAGAQHLDHDLARLRAVERDLGRNSAACTCAMDAAASGCLVEAREHLLGGAAVGRFDDGARDLAVERRHAILQLRELVGDVERAAGRVAWTAPGRTSRRWARAPRARAAAVRRAARRRGARPRSTATAGTGNAAGDTDEWRARTRRVRGAPARAGSR